MNGAPGPAGRKGIVYQTLLLGGAAALAAALLLAGNQLTRSAIAERQAEDLRHSLAQVLPPSLHDNNLLEDIVVLTEATGESLTVYRATVGGRTTGYAYRTRGQGFSGTIEIIMGIDPHGEVLGARVLTHAETPGLGDKIEVEKSDWITHFTGHSLVNTSPSQWGVKKDGGQFDQFSGATVTPRAVVKAVHQGLLLFERHRDELANSDPSTSEQP
ncbi:MAG: electron transport complex subunit RsxG [Pseudomonadota bacterium]|nr:electron transport complex subunit RsxG [Pseudomonadota bacterium]